MEKATTGILRMITTCGRRCEIGLFIVGRLFDGRQLYRTSQARHYISEIFGVFLRAYVCARTLARSWEAAGQEAMRRHEHRVRRSAARRSRLKHQISKDSWLMHKPLEKSA